MAVKRKFIRKTIALFIRFAGPGSILLYRVSLSGL